MRAPSLFLPKTGEAGIPCPLRPQTQESGLQLLLPRTLVSWSLASSALRPHRPGPQSLLTQTCLLPFPLGGASGCTHPCRPCGC